MKCRKTLAIKLRVSPRKEKILVHPIINYNENFQTSVIQKARNVFMKMTLMVASVASINLSPKKTIASLTKNLASTLKIKNSRNKSKL